MSRGGSGSLPRYILQRVLLVIPMIWVILTLVFFVLRVAPGDPVSAALGGKLNAQALEQRREALGFNRPMLAQYWDYLSSVIHLDFGTTFSDNQPVLRVIRDMRSAAGDIPLVARPNAGGPTQVGGRFVYPATPEYLAFRKLEVYRAAFEGLNVDAQITDKERAMLEKLRIKLGIQPGDAQALEEDMRGDMQSRLKAAPAT